MHLFQKRNCPECRGEMYPQLINMMYHKKHCDLHIEVIGIPANVCRSCRFRIIPGKIAKYIDSLVDPLVESVTRQEDKVLPTPHIDIQFPIVDKAVYAQ